MKRYFIGLVFLALLMGGIGLGTSKADIIYDDFSGLKLNEQKWRTNDSTPLDFTITVKDGRLLSKVGNDKFLNEGRNQTAFQNPSTINSIQCDIVVYTADLDSGANAASFARIDGRFYNAQNSGTERGDIWAGLYIGNRGSGLEAWWGVYESTDDDGEDWEHRGSGTINVPAPGLAYGTSCTVKLAYDGSNGFTFTVAGVDATFTGPARQAAEHIAYKALETLATSGGGDGTGYTSAAFDNVLTNGSTYDDFSSAPLDQNKWKHLEFVREIEDGTLWLTAHGSGARERTRLHFTRLPPCIAATIKIKSRSYIESGSKGRILLRGNFYNDTHGPGSGQTYEGYTGDVFAQVGLYLNDDDTLDAYCYAERALDANWNQAQQLIWQAFSMAIVKDRAYHISLCVTEEKILFACKDLVTEDQETIEYAIQTNTYFPYDLFREMESRVDSGGAGYLAAEITDVYAVSPVLDASGDWVCTITEIWHEEGECDENEPGDVYPVKITQQANQVVHTFIGEEEDAVVNGEAYGLTYSYKISVFDDGDGYTDTWDLIYQLESNNTGYGFFKYHEIDEVQDCRGGWFFKLKRRVKAMPHVPLLLLP